MALQTDLSRSPYFDDYDTNKNFYRILYRPSVSVQARELNQMQTILQDQIDKFGRHVFKEGSVIEGCSFTFDDSYNYVKIKDSYANGSTFTISDFIGQTVTTVSGLTTNSSLQAVIVNTVQGYESQNPDLNTLYIKYLNTGTYTNGAPKSAFSNGDNLYITTSSNVAIGNVSVATVANSAGKGYAFTTTAGIIFKKGFFINVQPATYIISKYSNAPDGISVGFDAVENIVTPEADSSLYDNAAGAPNFAAPGAHRLQLVPTLVVRNTVDVANTASFFSVVDFKSGKPVSIKNDPQYAALGASIAQRTYETNGNYVVYPFVLSTEAKSTSDVNYSNYINLVSSRGLGYAEGYRVEFVNNNKLDLRRSTDYESVNNQIVTASYGYYVYVNCFAGEFNIDNLLQVELHNVAKTAVTGSSAGLLGVSYSASTLIGTAFLRGFAYDSGNVGTGLELYRAYLFNIVMNPGKNFRDAKSIISRQSSGSTLVAGDGVADIILSTDSRIQANGAITGSNVAKLQSSQFNNMIFPFGQKATKRDGFSSTQFIYRNKGTSSFNTDVNANGSIVISNNSGGSAVESFNLVGSPLSAAATKSFVVVPIATGYSSNSSTTTTKTGTIATTASSNVVTGSGTKFLSEYMVGDWIKGASETNSKIITLISSDTSLTTLQTFGSSLVTNTHLKAFPAGVPIDFSKTNGTIVRSINVSALSGGSSNATFSLGERVTSSFGFYAYFDTLRAGTYAQSKAIKKSVYVAINCASHSAGTTGPYSLGFPDVFRINAIYINSGTYSNTGVNYAKSFSFNNGQKDTHYDLASITPTSASLTSTSRIIVDLDTFVISDGNQGRGFFTAASYPIDDANTANTIAITTAQIPQYIGTDGAVFDLRDSVDFRPFANLTANAAANSTNWSSVATVNPSGTLVFNVSANGTYLPSPDSNFQSNYQHYLKRVDKAVIKKSGEFAIVEGAPSNTPVPPLDQPGAMTLGVISVPAYPSLSTPEAAATGRYDYAVTTVVTQNKRYTMKDINVLSNKIDNLEYYTSLSLLEKQAKDTLVRSGTTGQNRFQNGIMVDPFAGHDIGNTLDPNYYISIDPQKTELRPVFFQFRKGMRFSTSLSTNVVKKGNLVLLNYTEQQYIQQGYASKYRNCIDGNIYVWSGQVTFTPTGDTNPDLTKAPDVVTNIDLASNFTNIASAFGTQWGNWSTTSTASSENSSTAQTSSSTDAYGNIINSFNTQTVATTTTTQQRAGKSLSTSVSTNQYNLGTYVTDVSLLPYVRSIPVQVTIHGMKPYTRIYCFINNIDVNAWIKPSASDWTLSADYGYALYTGGEGSFYGILLIPPGTFKSTTLEVNFYDVPNPVTGLAAITTKAAGTFIGSNISIAKGSSILSTKEATLSVKEVTDQQVITTQVVTNQGSVIVIPGPPQPDPIPDPGYSDNGGTGCCFDPNARVLMEDGSYKRIADVAVGDRVRGSFGCVNTVVGTKTTTVQDRKMIKFDGHDFYSTDDHLFLTDRGWKTWRPDRLIDNNRENAIFLEGDNRLESIDADDYLITVDGKIHYSALEAEEVDLDADYVVHDLHLDGNQTYTIEDFIVHNCGSCCFDPSANVLMADGSYKRIADVVVGDIVRGHTRNNTVVGTKSTTVHDRKMIKFKNYSFLTTDDHLFLTNNGWKTWRPDRLVDNNRDNLVLLEGENRQRPIDDDDMLVTSQHSSISYSALEAEEVDLDADYVVHDLHLDGDFTYIIEDFIVHNCCGDGGGGCCFDADAKVLMEDGNWKRIVDVVVGDRVVNSKGEINNVVGLKNTTVQDRKMIKFEDYDFYSTDDHLFLTNNGWKTWRPDRLIDNNRDNAIFLEGDNKSTSINAEDQLITRTIENIDNVSYDSLKPKECSFDPATVVYDIHLDGDHTYIIEGFIVHNCCN
jgi:hypothetical protein